MHEFKAHNSCSYSISFAGWHHPESEGGGQYGLLPFEPAERTRSVFFLCLLLLLSLSLYLIVVFLRAAAAAAVAGIDTTTPLTRWQVRGGREKDRLMASSLPFPPTTTTPTPPPPRRRRRHSDPDHGDLQFVRNVFILQERYSAIEFRMAASFGYPR